MNRWFRFYDDALNDAKVQRLSGDAFKAWINILCIASKNDGDLSNIDEVAFGLRLTPTKAASVVTELASSGLLDRVEGGYFRPHNWSDRQYKSDVSNERVKQFRKRKRNGDSNGECNVTHALHETPPDTEADTDTELERERDARAREENLVSREAFELSDSILKTMNEDREAPEWFGFPYIVQTWLKQKIPKDFIVSTCANLRGKHRNYLDKAVQNGWRDRKFDQQNPRKPNGSSTGNIIPAQDRILEKLAEFGKPIGASALGGRSSEDDVRLLSKG